MTKRVIRVPTPSPLPPPGHPRGIVLSDSDKDEALAGNQSGGSVSAGDRSFGPGSY